MREIGFSEIGVVGFTLYIIVKELGGLMRLMIQKLGGKTKGANGSPNMSVPIEICRDFRAGMDREFKVMRTTIEQLNSGTQAMRDSQSRVEESLRILIEGRTK